jgi:large subunit ribosomal protein L10
VTELNREQKSQVVAAVAERLERTEAVVATDFRGLTVAELADLRARLREAEAEMTVVKNTLSRRAVDQVGRDALRPYLEGPTGLVWVNGDPARAAKALSEFAKEHQEVFSIRGGILGDGDLPAASILKLATLPSREQMLAQLAGGLAGSLSGLAGALNALLSGLARTLAAVRDSGATPARASAPEAAPTGEDAAAAEEPAAQAAVEVPAEESAPGQPSAGEPVAEATSEEPSQAEEPEAPADEPTAEATDETPES